ncbi:MAG TPA: hypothetical protein VK053_24910, partial [Jiangellaceae bacterium]|nr:hypothetical protein [Jiangellaceae bacterium]
VGMPVLGHVLRTDLPPASGENPSFELLVQDPGQLLTELTLTGVYPALPWMAYIATGLLVGRLRLSSTRVATILLVAGAAMVVIASVVSWWLMDPLGGLDQLYVTARAAGMTAHDVDDMLIWGSGGTTPTTTWWWLATTAPHSTTPVDLAHTTGVAIALLGGMLLLADSASRDWPILRAVLDALGMIGAMTLTLYTAHVMYMNSPLDVFDSTTGYLIQVAVAVLFALIWRVYFDRGPLEALVTRAARAGRRAVSSR